MHNIIFPLKDTTIYSKYPEVNTGLDEILDIAKEVSSSNYFYRGEWNATTYYRRYDYVSDGPDTYYAVAENINEPLVGSYWRLFTTTSTNENSRILIKFDLSKLSQASMDSASVVYLNLFTSIAKRVPVEYSLEAYPLSEEWEMGVGNFTTKQIVNSATWNSRTTGNDWTAPGGDYNSITMSSQNFNFEPTDVRMDITDIFSAWKGLALVNHGVIIKRPDAQENNSIRYGELSFYSLDTHTVYLPTLEVLYDDHIYDTQSFESQSIELSSSFSSSVITAETVEIINGFAYYLSASVAESLVNIITSGSYPSSSLIYTASSIISYEAVYNSEDDLYLSSSIIEYQSASIEYFNIGLQPPDTYNSASYTFVSQSVPLDSLLYEIENFVTSTVSSSNVTVTHIISSSLISGSIDIHMKNFNPQYKYNDVVRFYFVVKPSYQPKTFYEEARPGDIYYVENEKITYSIQDAYSGRTMVPFSEYTYTSLNETGYFFDINLSGFMPERFYKILFKYNDNGAIKYIDKNVQFKVVK